DIVEPRQIAVYLMRTMTKHSFPEMARVLGNRDHTTMLHSSRKIDALVCENEKMFGLIAELRRKIIEKSGASSELNLSVGGRIANGWMADEDELLRQMIDNKYPVAHIAQRLRRTVRTIKGRAAQLGISISYKPHPSFPAILGAQ